MYNENCRKKMPKFGRFWFKEPRPSENDSAENVIPQCLYRSTDFEISESAKEWFYGSPPPPEFS